MTARVDYLDAERLAPADRGLLDRPINVFRALANRPEVLRPYADIGEWVRWRSDGDPRRREYVIITVGAATHCRYEAAHHIKIAQDFGATDADLDVLFSWLAGNEDARLPAADLAAVSAARELTVSGDLGDASWTALASAVGQDEALDLMVTTAYYGMTVRLLHAMRVENEAEFEPYARRFDDLESARNSLADESS